MQFSFFRYGAWLRLLGNVMILIAALVLLGWKTGSVALTSWLPGVTAMNPMTACTFIACGAWLFLGRTDFRPASKLLASFVLFFGLLHFITYLFPAEQLRMDYLLFGDKIRATGILNRVAPNTALNFLLCGLTMLLTENDSREVHLTRQGLIGISFILIYISILGYIFSISLQFTD